jgi:type II restriction enzyme
MPQATKVGKNKGEWSELYVLFKLLGEGKLYGADKKLQKIQTMFYVIQKIFRDEILSRKYVQRVYSREEHEVIIRYNHKEIKLPISDFAKAAEDLKKDITQPPTPGRTFDSPETRRFMERIDCYTIKAKSANKKDILIEVYDAKIQDAVKLGFSIKSSLGGRSSLFNAGKATSFRYRFKPKKNARQPSKEELKQINTPRNLVDRINAMKQYGYTVEYKDVPNRNFKLNLQMFDAQMPLIIGTALLASYTEGQHKISKLIKYLQEIDPCNFGATEHPIYAYKIKNFLTDVALGMTAATVWNGQYDATGGIIIVDKEAELVCFHVYNRNALQDYLVERSSIDTPDIGRLNTGLVFKENREWFIDLSLNIRMS